MSGAGIQLQYGRNVISLPSWTSKDAEKGGALYLQYAGNRAGEIKLQVRGQVTQIPMLES